MFGPRKIRAARSFELPICPEGGQLVFAERGRQWQTRLVQSLADLLPQAGAGVALMDLLEGNRQQQLLGRLILALIDQQLHASFDDALILRSEEHTSELQSRVDLV